MKHYEYTPKGVCSSKMIFEIDNNIIIDAKIIDGCPGNTMGITKLIKGKDIDEVINLLEGIPCRMKPTSCPDQLAKALKEYKKTQ